jgi:hypothetical protein
MQLMKKQLLCRLHLYPHLFLKKARMLGATREVFSGSADLSKNKKTHEKTTKIPAAGVRVQQFTNRF